MAGELTDYLEQGIIDHLFNKSPFTQPTFLYVGLATAVTDAEIPTGVSEPGSNYARKKTYVADWTRSGSIIDNDIDIEFVEATGSWGTITHAFLNDAASAGNYWCIKALLASKAITTGDTARFKAGELDFSMA